MESFFDIRAIKIVTIRGRTKITKMINAHKEIIFIIII